jgi:cyclopropane-fatty-acyl-phospholipid synthase
MRSTASSTIEHDKGRVRSVAKSNFSSAEKWLVKKIHRSIGNAPLQLVLGNGDESGASDGDRTGKVILRDRTTLLRMLLDPEVGFGDSYMEGRAEVDGDLVRCLEDVIRSMRAPQAGTWYGKMISRWLAWAQANTPRGSAKNIHTHYDMTSEFYKLWLDSRMVYTCAYFPTPSTGLEEAQLAKMDHVCRKVQLRPGEKVIEAGCGWGALAIHMAKHYGVNVRAFNISKEQIAFARERAKKEGLSRQVEFIEDDYRNISGKCDVFMSVGMLEHVGAENYKRLGRVIHRAMGDSGRGLLHFIGRNQNRLFSPWIRKRIFPGAHAPSLRQVMDIFEPSDIAVLDVENLRFHYARTLEHWLARFERSTEKVQEMFGADFVRAWRLYLAGSIAAFTTGSLQLFQVTFAGSECARIPWTRAYLYQDQQEAAAEKEPKWIRAMS